MAARVVAVRIGAYKENPGAATIDRYEHLAIQDIKAAAETLKPVYDRLLYG